MAATLEQKLEMVRLIRKLNQATICYDEGSPIISDKEWDDMYFRLAELEKETKEVLHNSPVHFIFYKTVSELKKVEHNHPMLSLDKTKSIEEVKSFIGNKKYIAMAKMDGLTCSLRYQDGVLVNAETRGNGTIGEDILHNANVISTIPHTIDYYKELVVDGEIICTYNDFIPFSTTYKNPRNFASGSIRLLDARECHNRNLTFVAWDCITDIGLPTLSQKLAVLAGFGFTVVPFNQEIDNIKENIEWVKQKSAEYSYPIDGVVFKYDNVEEYNAMGRTDHHFKGGLAFKFYDETYPTKLKYIDWTMGRTGVLTPVAVFDPVEIDGTEVTRASLHNVSIMKEILGECAYLGEPLEVVKMNQIIPQIISAGPKYNYGEAVSQGGVSANDAPEYCPICGGIINYQTENSVTRAYCTNLACDGKLINRLDHFCGKKGLDIKGLSKMTLEKLINWGWIENIESIFKLDNYRNEWIKKPGFGVASVDKILYAIQEGKKCTTSKYICALGIPLIGKVASEALVKVFPTYNDFRQAIDTKDERLYEITGIGEVMIDNLLNFNYEEADNTFKFIEECAAVPFTSGNDLEGKVFVITGKLKTYKNRDALKAEIESRGGKVTGSVTKNTSYLINNDATSSTAKNLTAKKLNIPIIKEEEFKAL